MTFESVLSIVQVICAAFGPRQTKKSSTFSDSGRLWCDYKYAPFANKGSRQPRSGQTEQERFLSRSSRRARRSQVASFSLGFLVEKALHDAIRFETFPKATLELYVLVLENDGSDFEAAVTCASAAIADAGVEMFDLVTAVSVGLSDDDRIVLDPRLSDLAKMRSVTSLSFIPSSQKITHVTVVGRTNLLFAKRMIESCLDGCSQLSSVIRTILTS